MQIKTDLSDQDDDQHSYRAIPSAATEMESVSETRVITDDNPSTLVRKKKSDTRNKLSKIEDLKIEHKFEHSFERDEETPQFSSPKRNQWSNNLEDLKRTSNISNEISSNYTNEY